MTAARTFRRDAVRVAAVAALLFLVSPAARAATADGTIITNLVSISVITPWGVTITGAGTSSTAYATVGTAAPTVEILVFKSQTPVSGSPVAPGDPIHYEIQVINIGTVSVLDLVIVDTLSPVLESVTTGQPAGWSAPQVASVAGGTRYVWSATGVDLEPGPVLTFTVDAVAGAVSVPETVENSAYAAGRSYVATATQFSNPVSFDLPATLACTDPAWGNRASLGTGRYEFGIATLGGLVYVAGGMDSGSNDLDSLEVYDPALDTWTPRAPMLWQGSGLSLAATTDKLYAVGAWGDLQEYDPEIDKWRMRNWSGEMHGDGAVAEVGGKLYAIGGSYFGTANQVVEAYDPATDSWTTKMPMPTARSGMGSAVVGGKIYVIGGIDDSYAALDIVEVYDPATDSWTTKAALPSGRGGVRAVAVGNSIYALGGEDETWTTVPDVFVYDTTTNTWSTKCPMQSPRGYGGAAQLGGVVYAIGGHDWSSGNVWDSVESAAAVAVTPPGAPGSLVATPNPGSVALTWTPASAGTNAVTAYVIFRSSCAGCGFLPIDTVGYWQTGWTDYPLAAGLTAEYRVRAIDTTGFGGAYSGIASATVLPCADPAWVGRAPLGTARFLHAAAALGGYIYVANGNDSAMGYTNSMEAYNPGTDTWEARAPVQWDPAIAFAATGDRLYALGGYSLNFSAYNPGTDAWDWMVSYPSVGHANGALVAAADKLYAIGGWDGTSVTFQLVEEYDFYTRTWTTKAPMPTARSYFAAAAIDGVIYAIGGLNAAYAPVNVVEAYDPATDTWTTKAPLPAALARSSASVVGNTILLAGGSDGEARTTSGVFSYDPATNTWTTKCGMQVPRQDAALATVGGIAFAIGGYDWGSNSVWGSVEAAAESPAAVPPSAPPTLAAVPTSGGITIDWSAASAGSRPVTAYRVLRSTCPTCGFFPIATVAYWKLGFADGGLPEGLACRYAVQAVDEAGLPGPASPLASASAAACTYPAWSYRAPMYDYRFEHAAASLNGLIYVAGGYDSLGETDSMVAYDPVMETWTTRSPLPVWDQNFPLVATGGKLYAIGSDVAMLSVYDPGADSWTPLTSPSHAHFAGGGAVVGGKLYAISGWDSPTDLNLVEEYDPAFDTWTTKSPIPTARHYPATAAVNGVIYVMGGLDGGFNTLDYVEAYDPATDTWTTKSPLPSPRAGMSVAVLGNTIFIAGGSNVTTATDAAVLAYDPASDTWTTRCSLQVPRDSAAAAEVDGVMYVIGGTGTGPDMWSSVEATAPGGPVPTPPSAPLTLTVLGGTGTVSLNWSPATAGTNPVTTYQIFRATCTTCVFSLISSTGYWATAWTDASLPSGTTLRYRVRAIDTVGIAGGFSTIESVTTEAAPCADPAWSYRAPMNAARAGHGSASFAGQIWVAGGADAAWNPLYCVESYEPTTNSWTSHNPLSGIAEIATLVSGGRNLYCLTGSGPILEYDPSTDDWNERALMLDTHIYGTAAAIGGTVYVMGGYGSTLGVLEAYDPSTNSWALKAPMPTGRIHLASAVVEGKLYAIGGFDGAVSTLNVVEAYDPASDSWTTKAPLPGARQLLAASVIGNSIYVVGGRDDTIYDQDTVFAYDPATDSWTTKCPIDLVRENAGAAGLGGAIWVTGGNNWLSVGLWDSMESAAIEAVAPPGAPGSLVATPQSSGSIALNWTAAVAGTNPVTGYAVFRSSGPGCGFKPAGITGWWELGFIDASLPAGTTPEYEVRALDTTGFGGAFSNLASATVPPCSATWAAIAPLSVDRWLSSAIGYGGLVYSIAGNTVDSMEAYDPGTGAWTPRASIPSGGGPGTSVAALGGRLYVISGGAPASGLFAYELPTDTWTSKAPTHEGHLLGGSAMVNGKMYAVGGWNISNSCDVVEEYDPAIDGWTLKAPMPTGRQFLAVVALAGRIYAIGGNDYFTNTALATVEVYDPATNTWTTKAPLPAPRTSLSAAVVGSTIYVFGGDDIAGFTNTDVYAYDPATDTWTTQCDLVVPRSGAAGAALGGVIYALSGHDAATFLTSAEAAVIGPPATPPSGVATLAAIASQSRITLNWSPATPGTEPIAGYEIWRSSCAACGFVYLATAGPTSAGYEDTGIPEGLACRYEVRALDANWLPGAFSPVASAISQPCTDPNWTYRTPMDKSRLSLDATVLGGKIYVAGGIDNSSNTLADVGVFDPATDTWTTAAPLPSVDYDLRLATAGGSIYAISGTDNSFLAYDPATDSWSTKASSAEPHGGCVAAAVDGNVYAIGGWNGTGSRTVEVYDPATLAWTSKASLPEERMYASGAVVGGLIYVIGGYDITWSTRDTVLAYNPATDTWTTKGLMPAARAMASAATVGSSIYVVGGADADLNTATSVFVYDPAANTWMTGCALQSPRELAAAVSIGDTLYSLGGWSTWSGDVWSSVEATSPGGTPTTPPSAPLTLTALGGPGQITLNWSPATPGTYPVTAYEIWRATCGSCPSVLLAAIDASVTSFHDFTAPVGVDSTYRIRAADTTGLPGAFSPDATATPPAPVIWTPGTVAACPPALLWSRTFASGIGGRITPAPDAAGDWIASSDHDQGGGTVVWRVMKWSPAGSELWTHDGQGVPLGSAMNSAAVDGWEQTVAAGRIWTGIPLPMTARGVTKYDPAGGLLWSITSVGGTYTAVAADSAGNVLLAGTYRGPFYNGYAVEKLDPSGQRLWLKEGGDGDTASANAMDVATDAAGNVYVTGTLQDSLIHPLGVLFVDKYDSGGSLAWSRTWDRSTPAGSSGNGVAVDSGGNTFVVGSADGGKSGIVLRYDSAGTLLWSRTQSDSPTDVAVDGTGRAITVGFDASFRLRSWATDGTLEWSMNVPAGSGVAIDSAGRIGVGGWDPVTGRNQLAVYSTSCATPPSAPLTLTALGGPGQIGLNWSPAAPGTYPVTAYEIWRATCGTCGFSLLTSVGYWATAYSNNGLPDGASYLYKVRAIDQTGVSGGFSETASGTVVGTPFATSVAGISTPASAAPGDTITRTISFSVSADVDATSLVLFETLPPYVHYLAGSASIAPDPGWDPDPGPPGHIRWTIPGPLPLGASGEITYQYSIDWGAGEAMVPGSGDIAAPAGTILSNQPSLSWAGGTPGGLLGAVSSVSVDWFEFVKTGPSGGSAVTYTLMVRNKSAVLGWSGVTVWDTVPSGLDVWAPGYGFDDPCDTWSMTPSGCPVASPTWSTQGEKTLLHWSIGGMGPGQSTYMNWKARLDPGIASATTVCNTAVVAAAGQAGVTGSSGANTHATVCLTLAPPSIPPSAPATLTALGGVATISLNWSPATPGTNAVTAYEIFRATCGTCGFTSLATVGYWATTWSDGAIPAGSTYWYQVRTRDQEGFTGAFTATVSGSAIAGIAVTADKVQTGGGSVGAAIQYSIVVTNVGTATITSLTVVDTVSPVIAGVVPASPPGWALPAVTQTVAGTRYAWSESGIFFAPGTSTTFTISGTIGHVCFATAVSNTAYIFASDGSCSTAIATNVAGDVVPAPVLSLTAVKQLVPGSGSSTGAPVGYRIVVANTGTATIARLTVVDTVSAVITGALGEQPAGFGAPVVTSQLASGTRFVWTGVTPLSPGAAFTFTITGTVGTVAGPTAVSNTAYVTARDTFNCSENRVLTNSVGFVATPVVSVIGIALTAVKTITPPAPLCGGPVAYSIVVANVGTETITNLTVVDTVSPVIVNAVPGTPAGWAAPVVSAVASGTRYVWSASGLSFYPGTSTTFTISGNTGLVCMTMPVSNTAFVMASSAAGSTLLATNVVGAVIQRPTLGLTIVKTQTPASPTPGSPINYTIMVTNSGAATLTSLVVVDTVSPVVTSVVATSPAGFSPQMTIQVFSGTIYSWTNTAPFVPGTTATFELNGIVGSIAAGTSISNTAYITAATACTTTRMTSNGVGFVVTSVAPPPPIGITAVKTQTGGYAVAAPIQYQIVVTNTGGETITSLTVVDTVSAAIVNVSPASPPGWALPVVSQTVSGTRYVWSASGISFRPGTSTTFTISGNVGVVVVPAAVSNTGFVIAAGPVGNVAIPTNPVGSVVNPPSVSISTVVLQTPVSPVPCGPITYRIVTTNTGTATVGSLIVVDSLSPVVNVVTTIQPAVFGLPTITDIPSGTRYVWTASGLSFGPGQSFTMTITGTVGDVVVETAVSNTAFATAYSPVYLAAAQASSPVVGFVATTGPTSPSAVLALSMGTPMTEYVGDVFNVVVTVHNTGTGAANMVTPWLSVTSGSSLATPLGGPSPAGPATIPASGSVSFTWTYRADGTGPVTFAPSVAGTDANTGLAISASGGSAGVSLSVTPSGSVAIVGGPEGPIDPTVGESVSITCWAAAPGTVEVRIYDMGGALVRSINGSTSGGSITLYWNGRDAGGSIVPPGGYPIQILGPGLNKTDMLGVLY